jgi:hypothetical protein
MRRFRTGPDRNLVLPSPSTECVHRDGGSAASHVTLLALLRGSDSEACVRNAVVGFASFIRCATTAALIDRARSDRVDGEAMLPDMSSDNPGFSFFRRRRRGSVPSLRADWMGIGPVHSGEWPFTYVAA